MFYDRFEVEAFVQKFAEVDPLRDIVESGREHCRVFQQDLGELHELVDLLRYKGNTI